jgi:hypothetical protein
MILQGGSRSSQGPNAAFRGIESSSRLDLSIPPSNSIYILIIRYHSNITGLLDLMGWHMMVIYPSKTGCWMGLGHHRSGDDQH